MTKQNNRKTRTAKTRHGEVVYINTTWAVPGGWEGYVVNGKGHAVLIFIPGE